MRPFKFACVRCGKSYAIRRAEMVGRKMRCTECRTVCRIEAPDGGTVLAAAEAVLAGDGLGAGLYELTAAIEAASGVVRTPARRDDFPAFRAARWSAPDAPAGPHEQTMILSMPEAGMFAAPAPIDKAIESLDLIESILDDVSKIAIEAPPAPAVEASFEDLLASMMADAEPLAEATPAAPELCGNRMKLDDLMRNEESLPAALLDDEPIPGDTVAMEIVEGDAAVVPSHRRAEPSFALRPSVELAEREPVEVGIEESKYDHSSLAALTAAAERPAPRRRRVAVALVGAVILAAGAVGAGVMMSQGEPAEEPATAAAPAAE